MAKASRKTFLRRLSFGRTSRRGPDLADMGTAFALDLAMEPPDYDAPARRGRAAPAPVASWRLWLGRKLGA